eukprot:c704_g1_i1.p1 GENE.c704_g1_i1~~c704_g1_i1.p1  ORF type:complete len:251 (-),score=38.80 c704_g1_i1:355-1023(-)
MSGFAPSSSRFSLPLESTNTNSQTHQPGFSLGFATFASSPAPSTPTPFSGPFYSAPVEFASSPFIYPAPTPPSVDEAPWAKIITDAVNKAIADAIPKAVAASLPKAISDAIEKRMDRIESRLGMIEARLHAIEKAHPQSVANSSSTHFSFSPLDSTPTSASATKLTSSDLTDLQRQFLGRVNIDSQPSYPVPTNRGSLDSGSSGFGVPAFGFGTPQSSVFCV